MLWATSTKGVSLSVIRGRAISAPFNTTAGSNCPVVVERRYVIERRRRREECRRAVALGHWCGGRWAAGGVVYIASNPTDRFPALSKLSIRRRTLTSDDVVVDVRRRTQGWCKQRKVQNMPLIWRMSYHATKSSHVTDHFLSTLLSLRYMRCVACWWKSRLTPAASVSVATRRRRPPAAPRVRARMLAHFMVRLYIAVVCSYGEALADRIVSRYFVWYRIVSIVFSSGCIVPSLLNTLRALFRAPATKKMMQHICRAVSDACWPGKGGGHDDEELPIYITLKWFKTNPCHHTQ